MFGNIGTFRFNIFFFKYFEANIFNCGKGQVRIKFLKNTWSLLFKVMVQWLELNLIFVTVEL